MGNKKPQFVAEEGAVEVRAGKLASAHLSIKSNNLEFMYFGGGKFSRLFSSTVPKQLVFEYNVSTFRGREYVKGFIRDLVYGDVGEYAEEDIAFNAISSMSRPAVDCELYKISEEEAERLISACPDFGTLFIAWDLKTLSSRHIPASMPIDLFSQSSKSCLSGILVSPQQDVDLSGYSRIIFLDDCGPITLQTLEGRRAEIVSSAPRPAFLKDISVDRVDLLNVFSALLAGAGGMSGENAERAAKNGSFSCPAIEAAFALNVFSQLGLISFEGGSPKVFRGIKTDLHNSPLYESMCALLSKEGR